MEDDKHSNLLEKVRYRLANRKQKQIEKVQALVKEEKERKRQLDNQLAKWAEEARKRRFEELKAAGLDPENMSEDVVRENIRILEQRKAKEYGRSRPLVKIFSGIFDLFLLVPRKFILILGFIFSVVRILLPPLYFELATTQSRSFFGMNRHDVHDRIYLSFQHHITYIKWKITDDPRADMLIQQLHLTPNYALAIFYALGIIIVTLIIFSISRYFNEMKLNEIKFHNIKT